jgi:hypothetical protein
MTEEVLTDGPLILRRWREAEAPTMSTASTATRRFS